MTISDRQENDRLQQRCARLQGELTRMTKRAKLYKAAVKSQAAKVCNMRLSAKGMKTRHDKEVREYHKTNARITYELSCLAVKAKKLKAERDQLQASYAHDRAMFTAREERTRQALQEGSQACLGDRCMCRTDDCQSRAVCGLSGRVIDHRPPLS